MAPPTSVPVAITGMAVLLPGARNLAAYWDNLVAGVDAISEVPKGRWDEEFFPDPVYCRRGGFVDGLAEIDAARFGIMPASVAGTEPDQLIALSVAADAIDDAGGQGRLPDRDRVGVVLGRGGYLTPALARLDQRLRSAHQLTRTLGEVLPELTGDQLARVREAFGERLGPERPEAAIGLVPNLAASRLANRLDLRGPAYTLDAACASSLIAVEHAIARLASGECDAMLAGGVHHAHDVTLWSVFARLGALSPSGRSRPFHAGADGVLIGEGTGIVVLKRLADAERDGDRVYAVIRGTGVAGDGRAGSLVSPDPGGQTRAVARAWRTAGLDPRADDALGLLEAHGTGTPAGDAAELATLTEVFGPPEEGGPGAPVIGSVKSMIGHAMPAAGAAGLIKAALALHHGTLPPTLHCDEPRAALERTRFRPASHALPWDDRPPRAAVNAFGFGGINAHVVLERAPSARAFAPPLTVREPELVLRLTAADPGALAERLAADDATLRGAAPESAAGGCRLGIVDPTAKRLALARRAVAKGAAWRGRNDVWFSPAPLLAEGGHRGGVAFLFPGLEAEFAPGALDDVAARFSLPAPGASAVANPEDLVTHGKGVLAVARLLDAALRRMGVAPDGVAGHSVGEWAAMRAGGMYPPEEADAILASFGPGSLRVPGVVFATVGASAERVTATLAERGGDDVVLSHENSPRQSMICGPRAAVDELVALFRSRRVLCQVLPFQSGFHTPMLAPYLGQLTEGAGRLPLRTPEVPVWSGTTARPFPAEPEGVRALFVRHLLEPVRFGPLIEAMYAAGFRVLVQAGVGHLGSLVDDTLQGRDHLTVAAHSPHHPGLAQLRRVATALWAEGAALDPDTLRPTAAPARRGPMVALDLGAPLVSLGEPAREELRAGVRAALGAGDTLVAPAGGATSGLDALAAAHPVAAELRAALAETATTAAAVLTARATGRAAPRTPRPRRGEEPPRPAPDATVRLRVSTEAMPYLLDHCFFPQRAGWPDAEDLRPVVPATTIVRHLMDAAEWRAPGRLAVAVHDVRLEQWVDALPPVDVAITGTERGPDHIALAFGRHARATVEVADAFPARPPAPWPVDAPAERPCAHTAVELYRDRWMFHGPAFRGMAELTAIGERHVRGVLTVPPAPGALLDNVGQLLGYWIMVSLAERVVVFPVSMREIRFFGPQPPTGARVGCHIRVVSVSDAAVEAEAQLTVDGAVWAEIGGWRDHRFAAPDARRTSGYPERRALSDERPGGWSLLIDRWPDLASRDLVIRAQLGSAERRAYDERPPRGRRQWLLGRIAAKDAVRRWLWERGEGPVFPAEIRVRNDASGRPWAEGVHGRELPPLDLSLAHRGRVAVAIVADRGRGVGIDVEEVVDRPDGTVAIALGPRERDLLAERCAATGEPMALWFTRFWAAKEAVAKARGTGLRGRPRDFAVVAAGPATLRVAVGDHEHRVAHAPLTEGSNTYVVAWTTPDPERLTMNDDEENGT
ncbi:type I polyketide synthase [Streptomyces radicis]|uniref:Acyltransferase domain-containing protein n=1 Tax=Streptomyces radicis TaxID=1750517 RepID=A0A3A9WQ87_9ACTN|nr:type I polyketide synthase [Streptomyces radicis]RKN08357.1 acyltransferase domain-containing protein [Streptomyces radicis]RKN21607.1 acyltransferase domain-containing protein [Streptomyces radicis]